MLEQETIKITTQVVRKLVGKDVKKFPRFHFTGSTDLPRKNFGVECRACGVFVNPSYVYIIDELKREGLIDKNYPYICCYCWREYDKNSRR